MLQLITLALLCVLYGWAIASFPRLARHRYLLAAALAPLWLAQVASNWLLDHEYAGALPRAIVELLLLPLVMAAMPIGLVRLASWAFGRAYRAAAARRGAAGPWDP